MFIFIYDGKTTFCVEFKCSMRVVRLSNTMWLPKTKEQKTKSVAYQTFILFSFLSNKYQFNSNTKFYVSIFWYLFFSYMQPLINVWGCSLGQPQQLIQVASRQQFSIVATIDNNKSIRSQIRGYIVIYKKLFLQQI